VKFFDEPVDLRTSKIAVFLHERERDAKIEPGRIVDNKFRTA